MPATERSGATAPPAASIAAAMLIPMDRIPREPIGPWALRLIGALKRARSTIRRTRNLSGELGFIGNNAGLIAAHRGEPQRAWRLTERQVWWHGRQARRSGDPAITACAVQPWVNLGRLEALAGRWREALARFAALGTYDVADRLEMGCVRVSGEDWSAVTPSREKFLQFLELVHVSDSLKAMMLNRRFELVLPFAAHYAERNDVLRWLCEEACVVAECRGGDPEAAVLRARDAGREANGWNRAVLRLRQAEAHACAGETGRAVEILTQLSGVVRQVSPKQKLRPELLPITARLAETCRETGMNGPAYEVARDGLDSARAVGDELIEIELLRTLAAASPEADRERWVQESRTLEEATHYARFRRGGPPPADPVTTELFDRLEEAYAN